MKPTHEIMENNFHRVASAANSVVSVQSGNRKKVASFLRKKVEEPLLRSGNSTLENLSCTVGTVVASRSLIYVTYVALQGVSYHQIPTYTVRQAL